MQEVAQGIVILNRYGPIKNACWILHNSGESAIVEFPPFKRKKETPPYIDAQKFILEKKLFPKYGFVTHPHWDHTFTLPHFRVKFPQTAFVCHKSFIEDPYIKFMKRNIRKIRHKNVKSSHFRFFDEVFESILWKGEIGGEPIYLIHAPKHSYGDVLIVFKGAMITGDWYIGDIIDCNDIVSKSDKINSINKVISTVQNLNYHIHMLFSAHGDHLFYDVDFYSVMEECKKSHKSPVHIGKMKKYP